MRDERFIKERILANIHHHRFLSSRIASTFLFFMAATASLYEKHALPRPPCREVITVDDAKIDAVLREEDLSLFTSEGSTGFYYVTCASSTFTFKYMKQKFGTARSAALYLALYIQSRSWLHPDEKAKNSQSQPGSCRRTFMKKPTYERKEVSYKHVTITEDEANDIIRDEQLELVPSSEAKSGYYGVFKDISSDDSWRLRYKTPSSKVTYLQTRFNSPVAAAIHFARIVKTRPYLHPLQKMIVKHGSESAPFPLRKLTDREVDEIALQERLILCVGHGEYGYKGVVKDKRSKRGSFRAYFKKKYSKAVPTAKMAALEYARMSASE
jgi:hypothetical protein